MQETHGLLNVWTQTDWLGKGVALTLLGMSVTSWCVIVVKTWRLMRLRGMAVQATRDFWHAHSFREGVALLGNAQGENPFRALAEEGAEAVQHHADNQDDLHGALNISDWVTSNLRRVIADAGQSMQSGLTVLASIGSTAPFVGLLGTVWGIYHALIGLSQNTGAATLDRVSGPVGEALIMTAFGLIVAIPAVLAYNALVRGNKAVLTDLDRFAHDLHAYFVTGARLGARQDANVRKLPVTPAAGDK
jgi:biopolymer transport protein ExbB